MATKWYDVKKETDQLTDSGLNPDLNFRINRFTKWFIGNVFGRALSYLVGWTGDKALMIRCTEAGILKTAETGSGFEHNKTYTGTSANAFAAILPATTVFSKVEIWCTANDMTFKRAPSMISFDDEFTFGAGVYYSFECVTKQLQVKSTVGGVHGTFIVIAWY